MHGGKNPQAMARAEERQQEAAAAGVVAAIWDPDAAPVTNPVSALQRLAGQLDSALGVLGEGLDLAALETQPVRAAAWLRVVRESRQLLADMERLGIAQRVVELEADRVRLMAAALGRVFDLLELDAVRRAELTRAFLAELRAEASTAPAEVTG